MVLVLLAFPVDTHQNANQKPIGSAPAYRAQCTVHFHPIPFTGLSFLIFEDLVLRLFYSYFGPYKYKWTWLQFISMGSLHSTHGAVFSITLIMQFSHCYCFASERKVTSAMLTPSCLMYQPFIGIWVSQEMIHETGTTTDSEHLGFGSTESVHWK